MGVSSVAKSDEYKDEGKFVQSIVKLSGAVIHLI